MVHSEVFGRGPYFVGEWPGRDDGKMTHESIMYWVIVKALGSQQVTLNDRRFQHVGVSGVSGVATRGKEARLPNLTPTKFCGHC